MVLAKPSGEPAPFLMGQYHSLQQTFINEAAERPTIMRSVSVDPKLRDVVERRILSAPDDLLQKAFGFVKFGIRLWVSDSFCLLAIGQSKFLRMGDHGLSIYKHPYPRLIDVKLLGRSSAVKLENSRFCSFDHVGFKGFDQAIHMTGRSSCIISQANIIEMAGAEYQTDLILSASFEGNLNSSDFAFESEMMLARVLSQHMVDDTHAA